MDGRKREMFIKLAEYIYLGLEYKDCGQIYKLVYLYPVKKPVNVRMTTAIIYAARFTFIGLQKQQQK